MRLLEASAIERASGRRFPAWTSYARAFSGNRDEAERIVRSVFHGVSRRSPLQGSVEEAHREVLRGIRIAALRSGKPEGSRIEPSVLGLLHEMTASETCAAAASAHRRLARIPRPWSRAIEKTLLDRPSLSFRQLADREGISAREAEHRIESGLRNVAFEIRPFAPYREGDRVGEHPSSSDLASYVLGALTGDEARRVARHGFRCSPCGDRLGTMILLRSSAAERLRIPILSPSLRRGLSGVLLAAGIGGAVFAVAELRPNPWEEHARREDVPRWFHDFLYRGDAAGKAGALAEGLDRLVRGDYPGAIEILEPLASAPEDEPEAAAYLGIARFLSGEASRRTVRLLEAGTSSTRAGRLARWYLANAHLVRGDLRSARTELQALAPVRDWFGRAAEALLKELDAATRDESTTVARSPLGD